MKRKKVGYLGPKGTFSEKAGRLYIRKRNVELIPFDTIFDLISSVNRKNIDECIVPIENSVEGSVSTTLDLLVKSEKIFIFQEIDLEITHSLIAKKGVKIKDITDVISHQQALAQCREFIRKKLKNVRTHSAQSTAKAMEMVRDDFVFGDDKKHVLAAIGAKESAKNYRLKVIYENINDFSKNVTRFVVLSKKDHKKTGPDKTSIAFSSHRDRPGALYDILYEFAKRKINLTKIESRPSKKVMGDYIFFVDLEGHRQEKIVREAFREVRKKTSFYKILGSYPKSLKNA